MGASSSFLFSPKKDGSEARTPTLLLHPRASGPLPDGTCRDPTHTLARGTLPLAYPSPSLGRLHRQTLVHLDGQQRQASPDGGAARLAAKGGRNHAVTSPSCSSTRTDCVRSSRGGPHQRTGFGGRCAYFANQGWKALGEVGLDVTTQTLRFWQDGFPISIEV